MVQGRKYINSFLQVVSCFITTPFGDKAGDKSNLSEAGKLIKCKEKMSGEKFNLV